MFPPKATSNEMQGFSSDPKEVIQFIRQNDDIAARFFDVVVSYLVYGSPHASKQYFIDPEYQAFQSVVRETMEIFVLAHEYGHCAAGHLEKGRKKLCSFEDAGGKAIRHVEEVIPLDWQQEFEADVLGLAVTLQVMGDQQIDPSLSYFGIEAVFSCIHVIERALSILQCGEVRERFLDSHPPSQMRRDLLGEMLPRVLGEERAAASTALSRIANDGIEELWRTVEPALMQMYADGARPHERWMRSG